MPNVKQTFTKAGYTKDKAKQLLDLNNVTYYRIAHTSKMAHFAKTTPLSITPYNVAIT
jgi:hypothetical protein